nr:MAG TPA: hypothetical protein [Caudoviricetes sp.]
MAGYQSRHYYNISGDATAFNKNIVSSSEAVVHSEHLYGRYFCTHFYIF